MLNEKRVKHMVKLASYENKNGAEDLKISSFFRKDYVSFSVLVSLLWVTLGYLSLAGMLCMAFMEKIIENLTFANAVTLIVAIIVGYLLSLILYGILATRFYKKKHQAAKNGVKKYLRDLETLEKMYEREDA